MAVFGSREAALMPTWSGEGLCHTMIQVGLFPMLGREVAMSDATPSIDVQPPRRWPYFALGVGIFLLGIVAYAVQMGQHSFLLPWYLPISGTIGLGLMIGGAWQRRGWLRSIGVIVFLLMCLMEWGLLLGTTTPPYTGPAQPGRSVPAFAAVRASGEPFTDKDLAQGTASVLVFFRGRW